MSKELETRITFGRSAALFMAFVGAINLLAMAGWVFNLPILASLRPEFIPMAPSTALIFLGLCGVWLINRVFTARHWMRILVQVSLVGLLIIVLILALRYFTGFGPDLENWLYPNPPLLGEIETAHISPLTAMGFVLAILAFLLMNGREPGQPTKTASGALSLAVLILSGINILGYLYGAPLFYGGTLIPVAVTTALSFMFLSLGLLMTAGPTCWPVSVYVGLSLKARLMRAFIPASIGIVLLQGLLSTASELWVTNLGLRVAIAAVVACSIVIRIITLISQNLSAEIERGNQARLKAENALMQSEARFRSLAETANDAIINIDRDGHIVFWNQAAEMIFGYSTKEMIGKSLGMVMPKENHSAHEQGLHRVVLNGESHIIGKTVEVTGLRKDGSEFPLALSLATWQVGEDVFFTGIGRDISERKQAETALIYERNLLATLLENIPDMIYFKDAQSRFIRTNQAHARRLGLNDPAQIIGKTDFDLFGEEHAQAAYADEQSIIRSGQPVVAKEEKETFLDGRTLWVSTTKMPLRNQKGEILGTFGISRDITDRKLADEALRESEERFRSLYENVPTGIYRTSPDGHIQMANPALVRMLGYESFEELSQRNLTSEDYWKEFAHEEFQKRIERDGEVHGLESSWKRKDGSIIYVRESAHLVQNENNQPIYYEGTVEDISEQIRAKDALQRSAASLRAVLQSTADGILAIGSANDVLYFNARFAELWRIPEEVMASKNDSLLLQHVLDQLSDPQSFLKKVQDLYRSAQDSFDILNFKDGRIFERLSRPLMEGAEAQGRVWSFRDITQRKRFELVQNAIYRITQAAITSNGIDALYESIHTILGELISAENFFIALYDSATKLISFPYFIDQYDEPPSEPKQLRGLTGYVIRSGRSLLATREMFDQLVQQGVMDAVGTAAEAYLRVPLKIEGRIIGVIGIQSYIKGVHFHQEDLDLLEIVSTQVAQAIGRKRLEEEILSLSLTDELTGLNNRRGFTLLAEQELKLAHRMKRAMLLFFGDVDNLKTINDSWGHAQGDQALKEISVILKQNFRESDILARISGDEFVVLAVDASKENGEIITNRIQAALDALKQPGDESYHLALSLGISFFDPNDPCTLNELLIRADNLMYDKKQGRKRK